MLLDPLQSQDLVVQAHVARDLVILQRQKAEWTQPVVNGNQDHAVVKEVVRAIESAVIGAYAEGTACKRDN